MKILILSLLIISSVFAQSEGKELSDQELSNKFVSVIKDREIENQLQQTQEYKNCREKAKFTKGANADTAGKAAADCVAKLFSGKSEEEMQKLADNFNLQSYGLIPSRNVKDITAYLTNKMYKSMTGVDLEEKKYETKIKQMKFGTRKFLDQKTFVTLYKSQLAKSALFQITNFCFNKLRIANGTGDTFPAHWKNYFDGTNTSPSLTDDGKPKFGDFSQIDSSDKTKTYDEIAKSVIDNSISSQQYDAFFGFCSRSIKSLCDQYELAKVKGDGGNACLLKANLQKIRKGFNDTALLEKEFDKMSSSDLALALDNGSPGLNKYDEGGEQNLNSLTNASSSDFLSGGDQSNDQKAKDCAAQPDNAGCEEFIVVDDSEEKIIYNAKVDLTIKKEAEIARLKELKRLGGASLKDYLKENGYLDLLSKIDSFKTDKDFEDELEKIFEAQKQATIKRLTDEVGKRQMTDSEASKTQDKKNAIEANAKEAKEERSRLAQAVLFNNIITSQLDVKRDDGKGNITPLGRNTVALRQELSDLESNQIQNQYFSGLKDIAKDDGKGISGNESIGELSFLRSIIGAEPKN